MCERYRVIINNNEKIGLCLEWSLKDHMCIIYLKFDEQNVWKN